MREHLAHQFADLEPLRQAKLHLLFGDLAVAEEEFLTLLSSETLSPRALEDLLYYLGLVAFERGEYKTAAERFATCIRMFPETAWKSRIEYHQALLAYIDEKDTDVQRFIKACDQDHDGSLFNWMVRTGLVKRQREAS